MKDISVLSVSGRSVARKDKVPEDARGLIMPDRDSVGAGTAGSGGFLPLQFPSAFAAFHASTPPGAPTTAMHHATHYHHAQ